MARFPQKLAAKGSQKWLQLAVNQAPDLLDRAIATHVRSAASGKITWLSPLDDDRYAEYRDEAFLEKLGLRPARPALRQFFPRNGPQWDGLGLTSGGEPLLVEAKAHIAELASSPTGATGASLTLIRSSLERTKRAVGSRSASDWSDRFYQYTNRLAHLHFLRALNKIPAYLVCVYFLNADDVAGPTTAEEWLGAIRLVHALLGIDERRLQRALGDAVVDVFVDVRDLEVATGERS
jgi:hypothetical protein